MFREVQKKTPKKIYTKIADDQLVYGLIAAFMSSDRFAMVGEKKYHRDDIEKMVIKRFQDLRKRCKLLEQCRTELAMLRRTLNIGSFR